MDIIIINCQQLVFLLGELLHKYPLVMECREIETHSETEQTLYFAGKQHVVVFDFLGKDSIRYYNEVPVEKRVFKNLQLFMEGKKPCDDLFDRLNVRILITLPYVQ